MKINLEKWIVKDDNHNIVSYKIISAEECCSGIGQLPIGLHCCSPENVDYYNLDEDEDGTRIGFMFEELYTWYDEADIQEDTRYHMITYCPCCGEKIEVNIIREVDKTEEYNNLRSQYDEIHKKWEKCDSKKKSSELETEWREINKVINGFYVTGSVK